MLLLVFYYSFIFLFLYLQGFIVSKLLKISLVNDVFALDKIVLLGLSFITLSTSIISIFCAVDVRVLIVIIVLSLIYFKPAILSLRKALFWPEGLVSSPLLIASLILIILVSSQMIFVADSGIHHAQTIQWIRKFGLVPGLANLQPQIGFNSAFFPVQALLLIDINNFFGIKDLLIYPLNGVLYLMLILRLTSLSFFNKNKSTSNIHITALVLLGVSILILPRWANSASPDMVMTIVTIYLFLFLIYQGSENFKVPVILVSCVLTFKLSAAMLSLVLLYYFHTNKRKLAFLSFSLVVGLAFFVPYVYRNYVLSGYLVFPLYHLDIFNPDWKVPLSATEFEYTIIKSWARISSMNPNKMLAMPMNDWMPVWFGRKDLIEKGLILSSFLVFIPIVKGLLQKRWKLVFISIVILINFLFWFWGAPDPRFVFGVLFINLSYALSFIVSPPLNSLKLRFFIGIFFLVCSCFYHRGQMKNLIDTPNTILVPDSFKNYEYEILNTNFDLKRATMASKSPCNNTDLPCSSRTSTGFQNIFLRDSLLSNGFKVVTK